MQDKYREIFEYRVGNLSLEGAVEMVDLMYQELFGNFNIKEQDL